MAKKLIQEEIDSRLLIKNFLLKETYINSDYPALVECLVCGEEYRKSCGSIFLKGGCKFCAGLFLTPKMAEAKFLNEGFILKEPYINTRTEILMECVDCHKEFKKSGHGGTGCIYCAGLAPLTIEYVHLKFLEQGLEFKEIMYLNSHTNCRAICIECQHDYQTTVDSVINQKHGCPKCAGNIKLTIEEVRLRLKKLDFILLEKEYKGKEELHEVSCNKCFHIWSVRLGGLWLGKSGCPVCNSNKNEKIMLQNLESFFIQNIYSYTIKCNDVKINRKKLIVDAFIEVDSKLILFEYNGRQHYKPVSFGGNKYKEQAKLDFVDRTKRDEWLRNYCQENNIILIEIDGREYKGYKIKPYLIDQILQNNIIPPSWEIAGLAD